MSWDAQSVRVTGLTCAEAAPVIRYAAPLQVGPLSPRYSLDGFSCSGGATERDTTRRPREGEKVSVARTGGVVTGLLAPGEGRLSVKAGVSGLPGE